MAEYIDRQAALSLAKDGKIISTTPCLARELLQAIPSADVEPVRHGRWEDATKEVGFPIWICSVCRGDGRGDYRICPWCGARMDGGMK